LTSAAHRLFTIKNDPEVAMPRSLHPKAVAGRRSLWLLLTLPLKPAPEPDNFR